MFLPLMMVAVVSSPGKDIVDTAMEAGSFKTLITAVQAAGLVDVLKGEGPFTVFAPTDAAFANLPKGTLETLLKPESKGTLTDILTYHVVAGKVMAKDVVNLKTADSVNGQRIDICVADGKVMVDGANVVTTDIACSNGVIHVIDAVIMPTSDNIAQVATKAGTFNTLLAAAKAAGLVGALTGKDALTVLAPNDEAFAKLPEGTIASLLKPENKAQLKSILELHIFPGRIYADQALEGRKFKTLNGETVQFEMRKESAFANQSKILATDIECKNGVVHVIDTVILPGAGS